GWSIHQRPNGGLLPRIPETLARRQRQRKCRPDCILLLRSNLLLRHNGTVGLIGTKTVAEGDTLDVCLGQLVGAGVSLYSAHTSRKWPGSANVLFVELHWRKGAWTGSCVLNDEATNYISPQLTSLALEKPYKLHQSICPYQGCYVHGMGFFL